MYDIEKIYEPESIEDAVKYLKEDDRAIVLSGGSDILIKNREGKLTGIPYVSIHNIEELKKIYMDDDGNIVIGAAASFTSIEENEIIQKYVPYLGFAVGQVGGPQIRNIGTIGGNICNGVPSADSATSVMVLEATLHLESADGSRDVNVSDFYLGAGKTVRKREELLTKIVIKKENYENYHGRYFKYAMRNAMDIATLGCCVISKLSDDKKKIDDVKIAYGVAAPTPIRAPKLEALLRGAEISEKLYDVINDNYELDVNPRDSWRASKAFRLSIICELTKRCLKTSLEKGEH